MILIKEQCGFRTLIAALACLVLGGALFGSGYLTDRDQIAFMNQHRTDEPAAWQAAMQQWRRQNAARFQQLQQEAQAMAQPPSLTPATPIIPTSTTK